MVIGVIIFCYSLIKLNVVKVGDIKGIFDVLFVIDIIFKLIVYIINFVFKLENLIYIKFFLN